MWMVRWMLVLGMVCGVGCEREAPRARPARSPESGQWVVRVRAMMPLHAQVDTALAADGAGRIFWVQRADSAHDETVWMLDADGVPTMTGLSVKAVLAAMGAADGTGHLQSLAWADERLYAYFNGGQGARVLAAVVRFDPATGQLRLVVETRGLMDAARMRASLDLAKAQLVPTPTGVWLYLHHSDAWALLRFRPGDLKEDGSSVLARGMERLPEKVSMTREGGRLARGLDGSLLMLDLYDASLWRIEREGSVEQVLSLVGLSSALSQPLATRAHGIVLFAGEGEPLTARAVDRVAPAVVETAYPALILVKDGQVEALGPAQFLGDGNVKVASMELTDLVVRGREDRWVSYDRASGALVELALEKE